MTPYEFSLRQEVLLEKGAETIGDFFRYETNNDINAVKEKQNPVVIMHYIASIQKDNILMADTEIDLARIDASFDVARKFLSYVKGEAYGR